MGGSFSGPSGKIRSLYGVPVAKPGIITLLTDFGLEDPYVGIMKGVILSICPQVHLVDLTHSIPPQDITHGAFSLASALPFFPAWTLHLGVIDPGVGTVRRAVAIRFAEGFLVGPDNGLFSSVLRDYPAVEAVELTDQRYWLTPTPSATFHGRDVFAPAAAHLAFGVPLDRLGRPIDPRSLVILPPAPCSEGPEGISGVIQASDHFGNLVTSIPASSVRNGPWVIVVAGQTIPLVKTYDLAPPGSLLALSGSHGFLEIAVRGGNARTQLRLEPGAAVAVRRGFGTKV